MSDVREAGFRIWVATSGTRKTTDIKVHMNDKRRNLVIPSGRDDTAWHGYPELAWKVVQVDDPWKPGKMMPKVIIPELATFTGTRVLHVDGKQRIFDAVIDQEDGYRNGRLVLDDFRNYVFSSGNLRHEVASLFKNRRHKMLDLYLACHSAEDISRQILALNPKLIIGYTTTMPTDTSLAKVANGQKLLDTINEVNRVNLARPERERYLKKEVQF